MNRRFTLLNTKSKSVPNLKRSPSLQPSLFSPEDDFEWVERDFSKQYTCINVLGTGSQGTAIAIKNKYLPTRDVVAKLYNDTPSNRLSVENEIKVLKKLNSNGCNSFLLCYQDSFVTARTNLVGVCFLPKQPGNYLVVIYDYFLGPGTTSMSSLISLPSPNSQSFIDDFPEDETPQDYFDDEDEDDDIREQSGGGLNDDNFDGGIFLLKITYTLLKAVNFMHQQGVAHLDLKPGNVIINLSKEKVQLIDFGLACMTESCTPGGTIPYMSREVMLAIKKRQLTIDEAEIADCWSIGIMLYQLFNQTSPFNKERITEYGIATLTQKDILPSVYSEPPRKLASVLNNVINGFLQVTPENRLTVPEALELIKKSQN